MSVGTISASIDLICVPKQSYCAASYLNFLSKVELNCHIIFYVHLYVWAFFNSMAINWQFLCNTIKKKYDHTQAKKTNKLQSSANVLPNCKTNMHPLQKYFIW